MFLHSLICTSICTIIDLLSSHISICFTSPSLTFGNILERAPGFASRVASFIASSFASERVIYFSRINPLISATKNSWIIVGSARSNASISSPVLSFSFRRLWFWSSQRVAYTTALWLELHRKGSFTLVLSTQPFARTEGSRFQHGAKHCHEFSGCLRDPHDCINLYLYILLIIKPQQDTVHYFYSLLYLLQFIPGLSLRCNNSQPDLIR